MNYLSRNFLNENIKDLNNITCGKLEKLPEKIIQFGEGNFLRAFVDWQINKLNSKNLFNGSVVVVQPIKNGTVDILNEQDGLYTSIQRGIINDKLIENYEIITCISRGLNPYTNWQAYLDLAKVDTIKYIISNTTEAGISYTKTDTIPDSCPDSFPAKLTMLLYYRYNYSKGSKNAGYRIIPCELIESNGDRLKEIILQHSKDWNLEEKFIEWVDKYNSFYNTLVDRIVPGYPKDEITILENKLGYKDKLLVSSEIFHLWVIQSDSTLKRELPFHKADLNVIWTDDITPYRTLKVRILNGLHTTFTIPSILLGNETVKQSMDDSLINKMIQIALFEEIIPTLNFTKSEIEKYASAVLERFRNPFIKHYLISITLNSISKFKVRVLPTILKYYEIKGKLPQVTVFSFACLLRWYMITKDEKNNFITKYNNKCYLVNDEQNILNYFFETFLNKSNSIKDYVETILSNKSLWDDDLTKIDGMVETIVKYLKVINENNFDIVLQNLLEKNK
ncbi:MAG TPA: tagaturonate reductase [Ignavibacteria bacterium]|jgi:tagaturonate reductase